MTQLLDYEITIIAYYTSPSLIVCQIQLIVPSKKKKNEPLEIFFFFFMHSSGGDWNI